MNSKKGSFEDVFSHLGTPQEVAEEWTALLALKNIVVPWFNDPNGHESARAAIMFTALKKWIKENP